MSRTNTIVDKEWPNWVTKKYFETGSFFSQSLIFKTYKTYNHAIFTHLVLKLYKNKNLRCLFNKPTVDAADKSKLYIICSTPELSEEFLRWSWNDV